VCVDCACPSCVVAIAAARGVCVHCACTSCVLAIAAAREGRAFIVHAPYGGGLLDAETQPMLHQSCCLCGVFWCAGAQSMGRRVCWCAVLCYRAACVLAVSSSGNVQQQQGQAAAAAAAPHSCNMDSNRDSITRQHHQQQQQQ
jgi:hypothetical protein